MPKHPRMFAAATAAALALTACGNGEPDTDPVGDTDEDVDVNNNAGEHEDDTDEDDATEESSDIDMDDALYRDFGPDGNEVAQAYLDYQAYVQRVLQDGQVDQEQLRLHATGQAQAHVNNLIAEVIQDDEQVRRLAGGNQHGVVDVEVDGNVATVVDCILDASELVDVDADDPAEPGDGVRRTHTATMNFLDDGQWAVANLEPVDDPDTRGCVPPRQQDEIATFVADTYVPAYEETFLQMDPAPVNEHNVDVQVDVVETLIDDMAENHDITHERDGGDSGESDYEVYVHPWGIANEHDTEFGVDVCVLQRGDGLLRFSGDEQIGRFSPNGFAEATRRDLQVVDGDYKVAQISDPLDGDEHDRVCGPLEN